MHPTVKASLCCVAATLIVLSVATVGGYIATSTFDTDAQAQHVSDDARGASRAPDHQASGSKPRSVLSADDDICGGTWYSSAPGEFLDNVSAAHKGALSYDLERSSTCLQFEDDIRPIGDGGLTLALDLPRPGTDWTSPSITLHDSVSWGVGDKGRQPATSAGTLSTLPAFESCKIRGE